MKSKADVEAVASAVDLLGRPLTARSVIASLLLGRHPPSAPGSLLVRWCALFGITETSARVALTRMVQRAELAGDSGVYSLAGRIRERQIDQDFALAPALAPWTGEWLLAIVHRGARDAGERVALRRTMEHQRMVSLRDGVWARPDNLPAGAQGASPQCTWWRAWPDEADVAALVEGFELPRREDRTCELLDRLGAAAAQLPDSESLAEAFVTGAAVAQHLRRDPLLPRELLPEPWHGDDLRAAYRTFLATFGSAVSAWADSG